MNMTSSINHLFPSAAHGIDFIVQDDSDGKGPYIAQWNLQQPQPTRSELEAAWAIIKDRPPVKTPEQKEMDKLKSDNEQLNLQVIDLFEQLITKGVI